MIAFISKIRNFFGEPEVSSHKKFNFSVKCQIILGVVFGLLEYGMIWLNSLNSAPLYMDTIFTTAASLSGLWSGLLCAAVFHILNVALSGGSVLWSICSFSLVLVFRVYISKRKSVGFLDIVFLVFAISFVISLEGAVIFAVLHKISGFQETSSVRTMYMLLRKIDLPVIVSAFLPRVPANLVDKGICIFLGFLIWRMEMKISEKFIRKTNGQSCSESNAEK